MKKFVLGLTLLLLPLTVAAKPKKIPSKPIKLVLSPASTIPGADIMKYLNQKCPNVTITLDSTKSDYMLQAGWAGNYKFTLFKHGGDAVFATTTVMLSNAVKDVCRYVNTAK